MSGTRLHSPMAPATDGQDPVRSALIVSHGSPSEQEEQELALHELAMRVNELLPDWRVEGATVANKGRIEEKAKELLNPAIFPFFMAEGWFTQKLIADKAEKLGLQLLAPFGVEDELVELAANGIRKAAEEKGWKVSEASVLVAAHGSAKNPDTAQSTITFADRLNAVLQPKECRCGFVEQEPDLETAATGLEKAVCLSFFALEAGHVKYDLPEALETAQFDGVVLPPFIHWPQTASLIARSLVRQTGGHE